MADDEGENAGDRDGDEERFDDQDSVWDDDEDEYRRERMNIAIWAVSMHLNP